MPLPTKSSKCYIWLHLQRSQCAIASLPAHGFSSRSVTPFLLVKMIKRLGSFLLRIMSLSHPLPLSHFHCLSLSLFRIGTAGIAVQVVGSNWPKPHYTLLITGLCRFKVSCLLQERPFVLAEVKHMQYQIKCSWSTVLTVSLCRYKCTKWLTLIFGDYFLNCSPFPACLYIINIALCLSTLKW